MRPTPWVLAAVPAFVATLSAVALEETGYRIKVASGAAITAKDDWIAVEEINRADPETMCRSFKAVQFVVPMNTSTQRLEQSLTRHDTMDAIEFDFTRPNRPYVRIEIKAVTVTNVRTLDGSKQRVTLRYESCSVKEKKASGT